MSWIPSYKKPGGGSGPEIVTWADGTDEQIVAMLEAHYNGDIDVTEIWSVGDERDCTITYNLLSIGTKTNEPAILVLMNAGGKELSTPINGHTECAFVVGVKNCLDLSFPVETTETGIGWDGTALRTALNKDWDTWHQGLIINSDIMSVFKHHKNYTLYSGSTFRTSDDLFALPAEKEVFGKNDIGTAESQLSQFEYYKTTANRIKVRYYNNHTNYTNAMWFTRTYVPNGYFVRVYTDGTVGFESETNSLYIAPFGVI